MTTTQLQEQPHNISLPPRDRAHRSALGQFFTPVPVAEFMAQRLTMQGEVHLLDAGAGVGSLTTVALTYTDACTRITAECWEVDTQLLNSLRDNLRSFKLRPAYSYRIHADDFITIRGQSCKHSAALSR